MAETRTYNYGGAAPSWQEINLTTYNTKSALQSYTTLLEAGSGSEIDSGTALLYVNDNYPASSYRGNHVLRLIWNVVDEDDLTPLYIQIFHFERIHSDVVTSTFNGNSVHRVVRQTAFRTGTMTTISNRISSLSSLSGIEVGMTVVDLTGQIPPGTVVTAISPNLTVNFFPSGAPGTTINVNVSFSSTSFQRQLNFGKTVDSANQVSRTSTSLTWSLLNRDQAGTAADVLAVVTSTSTVVDPTTTRGTNVAGNGGSVQFTATGLSPSTTYFLNTKTSKPGDSILDSEVWNESWSTLSNQTATPVITDFNIGDLGGGEYQYTYRVRNEDTSSATIRSDAGVNPPVTSRGSVSPGSRTTIILGSAIEGQTVTLFATAQASGKTLSAVRSYTFTATAPSGGGGLTFQPF